MQLDIELYRESVQVEDGSGQPVRISFIDVAPERPMQTLVLIHGFGGNAGQWRYQIEQFANHNRVIAIDLRGHGRSSWVSHGFEMERLLADITTVLDHRGVSQPVVLIGHSYGVALATELAWHYPQRVSHLILVAGAGEYNIADLYKVAFRLPESVLRFLQPLVENFVRASLRSLKQMYLHNLRVWRGWDKFPELKMPTMVILGNRDRVLPQEAFERVADLVPPDSEIISVGVSAHMVMLERRNAVNRAIERFIETDTAVSHHSQWRSDTGGERGGLLHERPWLASYESAVPVTIDVPRILLTRLLDRAWRRFPRQTAIVYKGRGLSYKVLSTHAARFAHALRSLGVDRGTRVMLLLPNVPQFPIAYYGTLRLGAVAVIGNPQAATAEIVREAKKAGAEVLVTLTRFEETAVTVKAQSPVRHVIYTGVKDYLPWYKWIPFTLWQERRGGHRLKRPLDDADFHWHPLLRQRPTEPPDVEIAPSETAVIQFTSGTTGNPKGIVLSHRNLVANTLQTRAWLTDTRDGTEVVLAVVPFSHVYGMTAAMNVAVAQAATMLLLPTFDTDEVLETIRQYRPTLFPGVPAMYVAINNYPNVRQYNVQSIRACISGAAPLPIEVKERFEKLTKGKLVEGYGLSEAGPVTHANPLYGRSKTGSIGVPLPSTEARVVDLTTGRPLPPGEIGELVVRGPQVMQGYWQDDAATRKVLDQRGWLRTNDIARMDEDGYFQIIARRQHMWTADDETPAFPRDLEEVIYEIPEVNEVVVVAIANQPIAFVSLKEGARIPAKTIIEYSRRRLPPGQVPRLVIFVKEFPRNFIGKVLRRELVSQYAQEITAEAGSVGEHLAGLDD